MSTSRQQLTTINLDSDSYERPPRPRTSTDSRDANSTAARGNHHSQSDVSARKKHHISRTAVAFRVTDNRNLFEAERKDGSNCHSTSRPVNQVLRLHVFT